MAEVADLTMETTRTAQQWLTGAHDRLDKFASAHRPMERGITEAGYPAVSSNEPIP